MTVRMSEIDVFRLGNWSNVLVALSNEIIIWTTNTSHIRNLNFSSSHVENI